jgi:hypothetical protein
VPETGRPRLRQISLRATAVFPISCEETERVREEEVREKQRRVRGERVPRPQSIPGGPSHRIRHRHLLRPLRHPLPSWQQVCLWRGLLSWIRSFSAPTVREVGGRMSEGERSMEGRPHSIPHSSCGLLEGRKERLMLRQSIGVWLEHVIGLGVPIRAILCTGR